MAKNLPETLATATVLPLTSNSRIVPGPTSLVSATRTKLIHAPHNPRPTCCATSESRLLLDLCEQLCEFSFAVLLVKALIDLRDLGSVHRAEFRAAHRAELSFLVEVVRQCFIVHGTRRLGVKGKSELLVP